MKIKRGESISLVFVMNNVPNFSCLIRKNIFGFYERVNESENTRVKTILQSPYFIYRSGIFSKWKELLFRL